MSGLAGGFSAALFCGGRSTRMGQDKAFLPWGGSRVPLWKFQMNLLRSLEPDGLILSARGEQAFPADPDWLRVPDKVPDRGPLAGLEACLRACDQPHLLCLAVDMPDVSRELLLELLERRRASCGVVPRVQGRWEGLAAVYPQGMWELVDSQLRGNDRSLQHCLSRAETRGLIEPWDLDEGWADQVISLNAPADLVRYQALRKGGRAG